MARSLLLWVKPHRSPRALAFGGFSKMTRERHELWKLADSLQMDLRAAQAKLTQLRSYLAGLDLPDGKPSCPVCGYRSAMNMPSVAEHLEQRHPERVAA